MKLTKRKFKKSVEESKEKLNGPASKRRRRCSAGNFWEAREVPTEPAEKKDLGKYVYQECVIVAIDKGRRKVKSFKSEEGHFNVELGYLQQNTSAV